MTHPWAARGGVSAVLILASGVIARDGHRALLVAIVGALAVGLGLEAVLLDGWLWKMRSPTVRSSI